MDDIRLNPDELRQAASRIDDYIRDATTKDLEQHGSDAEFGHAGLQRAFSDFCLGAKLASEVLAKTAEGAGNALRDAAQTYTRHDDSAQTPMHQIAKQLPEAH